MPKKSWKRLLVAGGLVIGVLAVYATYILTIAGEFKTYEPHFDGSCRPVPGVVGAEDLAALADGSGVFVSADDRRAHLAGRPVPGGIYFYDLQTDDVQPVNLTPQAGADFHPHGIGLFEGEKTVLFVVNHPRANVFHDIPGEGPAHTIEVFDWVDGALVHRETIVDEALLVAPNDVAPVGPDTFYVSNDHGSGKLVARKLEDYLRLARAHLLFFDGERFERLPGNYRYANGLIASRDTKQLYLAALTDRTVHILERTGDGGDLELKESIFVGTGVDNITMDEDGDLWLAAHTKLLTFVAHMSDPSVKALGQVLRIDLDTPGGHKIEEIAITDGEEIQDTSVALRVDNRLLIGSVFGANFLDCELGTL